MIEDAELVEQARSGDSGAFAELYERYFDRVYDFLARMVRSDAEAADLAQDTFLRAMNSLSTLAKGASFKSWLFTIARNTALNRLERASRSQPLEAQNDAGESVPRYEVIDSDQFANPEAAAEAEDLASIVWEAAAALDPKSYSVLHLTVREGLDSAEIAGVLGVTRNNAYVMVNRMKKALEDAIGALALFKNGRSQCRELDVQLRRFEDATMSPEVRRLIDQHARTCATCSERRSKLASPFGIFAGMAAIRPMAGVKDGILGNLQDAFAQAGPAGSVSGAGADASMGAGSGSDGNRSASQAGIPGPSATTSPSTTNAWPSANDAAEPEPRERRRRKAAAVLGAVALLLLLGGITAFALGSNGDDEADGETALLVDSTPGATDTPSSSQTATLTATQPAATSTPPTPVHAEDGSQPGLAPGGGGPDATSTPAAAPPAAPDPGGPSDTVTPFVAVIPTSTWTPEPTLTPAPTITPSPTDTPTITPTVCAPTLSVSPSPLVFNDRAARTAVLKLQGCGASQSFTAQPGLTWILVSPQSGSIADGGTVPLVVNVDLHDNLAHSGRVHIEAGSAAIDLIVQVNPIATPTPTLTPRGGGGGFITR